MSDWNTGGGTGYEAMFNTPFTDKGMAQLIGKISKESSKQPIAATVAAGSAGVFCVADFQGYIADLYLIVNAKPAATETLLIDVTKAPVSAPTVFTSVLSATYTLTATNYVQTQISLYNLVTTAAINIGDVFSVTRTLTNGSALAYNSVVLEPSTRRWK
jgi:hypothetical protein